MVIIKKKILSIQFERDFIGSLRKCAHFFMREVGEMVELKEYIEIMCWNDYEQLQCATIQSTSGLVLDDD